MTDNEIIARWAYTVYEGSGFTATEEVYIVKGDDKLLVVDNRTDEPPYYFMPDKDIYIWHDGLLERIEENGLERKFYLHWVLNGGLTGNPKFSDAWLFRRAEPAQLTDALVATIKEVSDGK